MSSRDRDGAVALGQRAQLLDLGLELGDGLLEIQVGGHRTVPAPDGAISPWIRASRTEEAGGEPA